MAIALIIAVFLGGGAFAAEGSLPGDALYPVKVGVNEEVRSIIAFSGEAKARWNTRLAERRLEEAEKLAAEGRLNAEARAEITPRFTSHVEAFERHAARVAEQQNAKNSLELHSNHEASLKAHEQVLARIAEERGAAEGGVGPILAEVRLRLQSAARSRGAAEAEVSASEDGDFITASEGKLRAAENKLAEVRAFMDRISVSVDASVYERAKTRLKQAEDTLARGKSEREADAYSKAFVSFQETIRLAQEAKLLATSAQVTHLKIEAPGVNIETGADARLESEARTREPAEGEGEARSERETEASSGASVEIESETTVGSEDGGTEAETESRTRIEIGL